MDSAAEVKRLQRCLNDLLSLVALPAMWSRREPCHIASTLLEVLVRMVRLDFAYLRLSDSVEGSTTEFARSTASADVLPRELGRALAPLLSDDAGDARRHMANPLGDGTVLTLLFRLGTQDEVGALVVGSRRTNFPCSNEQLLMRVAANQATMGLQEARYARQQQRATEDLERRVAARTSELARVNQELRNEVLARKRAMDLNRDLAGRLIASQEAERQRIARELHDDLGQNIALLNIEIAQVAARIDDDEARSRLQGIAARAGEVASDLHDLSHALHPTKLQTLGLQAAVHALCRDVSQQGDVRVVFTPGPLPQSVDPAVSLCLYRIAQEALRNIARHSGAPEARMRLTHDDGHLVLEVADAGAGFDPNAPHAGLGLVSMRERVAFLNGWLSIDAATGGGTRIEVRVPLSPAARESVVSSTEL